MEGGREGGREGQRERGREGGRESNGPAYRVRAGVSTREGGGAGSCDRPSDRPQSSDEAWGGGQEREIMPRPRRCGDFPRPARRYVGWIWRGKVREAY